MNIESNHNSAIFKDIAPKSSKKQKFTGFDKHNMSNINMSKSISNGSSSNGNTTSTSSASSGSNSLDNLIFLNSVKVEYPIYQISKETLRFIPESQLDIIKPFIEENTTNHIINSSTASVGNDKFITKRKYSTNVDERNYLTVYEYKINDNWIIWDYSTGYVFFTGLWKSCGNNKTDIVKLVENFPNLSNVVKRVRGGFLKIQGTWLPFDVVKNLAKNFCFNIRYCLIPIFGEDFPDLCLKPYDANFGKLIDLNSEHQVQLAANPRRRRSSTNNNNNNNNLAGVSKPPAFKKRSKSDNYGVTASSTSKIQLLELEEILKASKSLHDLSSNIQSNNYFWSNFKSQNFQYGGFIWHWNDENNLCIIGKDDEAIIDEETTTTTTTTRSNHQTYPPIAPMTPHRTPLNTHTHTHPMSQSIDQSIPKNYDGFDTILNAAHQLMNFHTSSNSNNTSPTNTSMGLNQQFIPSQKKQNKMNINGLLS